MTSVGVRQHTQDVCGCPCVSVCVGQHTKDVRGCPCVSVCVRLCPSAHIGRPWLSISRHISMLFLGLSTLAFPVDSARWPFPWTNWVIFGPRGLSVQYTQDVRGCPPAHTEDVRGCPWLSISTHRTSVAVRVCVCVCPTHRTCVGVCQQTQDVRGCSCLSVCVRLCPSAHTGHPWLSISTHISTLVLGPSTLALPLDCLGDFGPRVLSVQYTQDVRGCPPAHTGRLWLSVAVRQHTKDVCGCPCVSMCVRVCPSVHTGRLWVSVSTHKTSVCVRQYTQDVCGCPCVCVCLSAHTGRPWLSISTHMSTLVLGLSTLTLPVDCLGDFGPCGLSVQYTQDVLGCPPAHTGRPTHISTLVLGLSTLALPVDCSGDFGRRGLSVQYTHDVCGCPQAHTRRQWLSVAVRVCPCVSVCVRQHTQNVYGCPSVHISACWSFDSARWPFPWTVWVIFGPRGLSVQYTQDVCGCPSAHTERLWLSVAVRQHVHDVCGCPCVCPCVSVSTHRTSVGVRQYTHDVRVCPSKHRMLVAVRVCPHRTSMGVRQQTQDVRGCPCLSVCVRLCLSAQTGRQWLSIIHTERPWVSASTHMTSVAVCGCPSAHTGRPWLSMCVHVCPSEHTGRPWVSVRTHRTSVCVRQHTQDVCGCPCVSVSTHRTSVAVHQYTYQHVGLWSQHSTLTLPVDCSGDFGPRGMSVQYTHDVRGCPPAHTGRLWLSVCVRVCPSVSVSTQDVRGCPLVHISAH
ncbi:hypothetical protein YC2023_108604 [Brassica napus]